MDPPLQSGREARRFSIAIEDNRSRFERDCDRKVLYSSAFRRLAGITQIVRAGEADVFHTRQQHTFKVAQVGKRLAQRVCREQPKPASLLGIDADVVETACLAHDLGHPPFGHVGEKALDELTVQAGDAEWVRGERADLSYSHQARCPVSRALWAGSNTRHPFGPIKYPWFREVHNPDRKSKWGAYRCDSVDFDFARDGLADDLKTAEAEIMDWVGRHCLFCS